MGVAAEQALGRAREGAPHGELFSHREEGELELACVLRPQVGMGSLSGVPYVAALGACEGLEQLGVAGVGVGWPADVVLEDGRGLVARVRTSAGYAEGMFVVCSLSFDVAGGAHADALPADEQVVDAVQGAERVVAGDFQKIGRLDLDVQLVRLRRAVGGADANRRQSVDRLLDDREPRARHLAKIVGELVRRIAVPRRAPLGSDDDRRLRLPVLGENERFLVPIIERPETVGGQRKAGGVE